MHDETESPFLDQEQAASFLNLSPRTLEHFRRDGRGPVYHKFGGRCLYHRDDLAEWAQRQRRLRTRGEAR